MALLADPRRADVRADVRADFRAVVDAIEPVPYRVVGQVPETPDTVSLTLEAVDAALAPARPGQFVMVWVFGVGEIPISVSSAGDERHVVLTVRSVGAVSAGVMASALGDVIGLRGPYGTAWPVADVAGRDVVVVAGGLGLAPLRMAVDELACATGARAPLCLTVVVGSRQPDQLLYPADLARWAAAGVDVHATVDAADRNWHGAVGTATAMLERLSARHDAALVCGPELMMTSAARACLALGAAPDSLWVSLERNMHCGIAHCGRCQLGPLLLCRDGAVVRWDRVVGLLEVRGQ